MMRAGRQGGTSFCYVNQGLDGWMGSSERKEPTRYAPTWNLLDLLQLLVPGISNTKFMHGIID